MKAKLSNSQRLYFLRSTAHFFTHLFVWLSIGLLSACAPGSMGHVGNKYLYGFEFDAVTDMRDIKILECEYLTTRPNYGIRCETFNGEPMQRHGQAQYMYTPSSLYVKWIDLRTNYTYQAKADLKAGIPKDFNYKDLYQIAFACDGDLLEVFLVTYQRRPADWPEQGPHSLQKDTGIPIFSHSGRKTLKIASVKGASM